MSAKLTVHTTTSQEATCFETYWTTGRKQGIVKTSLADSIDQDRPIIAELSAIHFLLSHQHLLGEGRAGNQMEIEVTFGAIRKLSMGSSTKGHLMNHGKFLLTRYADAKVTVSKDSTWIVPERAINRVEFLDINEPLAEIVDVAGVGSVSVSYHLLDRMMQRANYASITAAWQHLCKMLCGGQLARVALPPSVAKHKAGKHGSTGIHLKGLRDHWHFVIAQGGARPTLVTAYIRL